MLIPPYFRNGFHMLIYLFQVILNVHNVLSLFFYNGQVVLAKLRKLDKDGGVVGMAACRKKLT